MLFIYLAMIDDDTQRSKFEYIYHTYYGMMYKVAYELTKDQRLLFDKLRNIGTQRIVLMTNSCIKQVLPLNNSSVCY